MGAKLIYSGTTGLEVPPVIREKLKAMNANFTEVNELTIGQHE